MNTIQKLPPPMLAILAIGGLWWLTQRRNVASTPTRGVNGVNQGRALPIFGQQAALKNRSVQAFGLPPSRVLPVTGNQSANGGLGGLVNSVLTAFSRSPTSGFAGTVVSSVPTLDQVSGYSNGGPSQGYYGVDQALSRPAGYQPVYSPDSVGEIQAQDYALANPTDQIDYLPPIIGYAPDANSGGGWLDNQ